MLNARNILWLKATKKDNSRGMDAGVISPSHFSAYGVARPVSLYKNDHGP